MGMVQQDCQVAVESGSGLSSWEDENMPADGGVGSGDKEPPPPPSRDIGRHGEEV